MTNWFVDPAGSDSNSGRSSSSPFASFAPLATCGVQGGDVIGLLGGGLWRTTLTIPASGVTVQPYGPAIAPRIYNSVNICSGSWARVTGKEYKVGAGGAPGPDTGGPTPAITWIDGNGLSTSIYKGTAGSLKAGQWAISGGELHVNVGRAPVASDQFEVGNPSFCVAIEKSNVLIRGLDLRYAGTYSIGCNVTNAVDDVTVEGCEISWNSADAMNVNLGTGTNIHFLNNHVHDQPSDGAGGGDGFSAHGAATGLVQGNRFERCGKNGADMTSDGVFIVRFNQFDKALYAVGSGSGKGSLDFYGNTFTNDPTVKDTGAASYHIIITAMASSFIGRIYNNSLNAGTKVAVHYRGVGLLGGGTLDFRNNIIEGPYSLGLNVDQVILTEDYNNIHGATTRASGVVLGPNDLNVSPLFASPSTGDFSLLAGSPCIGAGVVIPNYTTGAPPNMGNTGANGYKTVLANHST
jgi:hypothetical protein